jgi:membrane protein DedA with SNARE-associated domain/membrane-associated phospholipid phosphatase
MIAAVIDVLLRGRGWGALALVFALPALEASAFVGFVFPGELAVLAGGVLASQGRVSLAGALAAAILGAVVGDSVGYWLGRRWGRAILRGTIGRLPVVRRRVDEHLDRAERSLGRWGPLAVVLGRFTAGLRVLVPGLAGMSRMRYRAFLAANVVGGILWGSAFVLLGYSAGTAWRRWAGVASEAGLVLLVAVVLGLVALRATGGRASGALAAGIAGGRPAAWIRRRFPRQVAWARRRLDPSSPRGFPLTLAAATGGLCAWAFGVLAQDVVAREELALLDPRFSWFAAAHRTAWATPVMRWATWLGSALLLAPIVIAVQAPALSRRRDPWPLAYGAAALSGSLVLSRLAEALIHRGRPPARFEPLVHAAGSSFPSGHAAQAVAVWGMLAILAATAMPRRRWLPVAGTAAVVLVVGASQLYLGAHWLTDVLAGYALGGLWLSLLAAAILARGGFPPAGGQPSRSTRARSRAAIAPGSSSFRPKTSRT